MTNIVDTIAFSAYSNSIVCSLRSKKAIKLVKRRFGLLKSEEQRTSLNNDTLNYLRNYQISNPSKFVNIAFECRVLNALLSERVKITPKIMSRIYKVRNMLEASGRGQCNLDEAFRELNSLTAMFRQRDRQTRRLNYKNQGNNQIIEVRTIRQQLLNQLYVEYVVSSILEGNSIDESLLETITDTIKKNEGNIKFSIFLLTVLHYATSSTPKFDKWLQEINDRRYQAFLGKDDSFAYRKAVLEIEDLFFSYIPPIRVIKDIVKNIKTYFN